MTGVKYLPLYFHVLFITTIVVPEERRVKKWIIEGVAIKTDCFFLKEWGIYFLFFLSFFSFTFCFSKPLPEPKPVPNHEVASQVPENKGTIEIRSLRDGEHYQINFLPNPQKPATKLSYHISRNEKNLNNIVKIHFSYVELGSSHNLLQSHFPHSQIIDSFTVNRDGPHVMMEFSFKIYFATVNVKKINDTSFEILIEKITKGHPEFYSRLYRVNNRDTSSQPVITPESVTSLYDLIPYRKCSIHMITLLDGVLPRWNSRDQENIAAVYSRYRGYKTFYNKKDNKLEITLFGITLDFCNRYLLPPREMKGSNLVSEVNVYKVENGESTQIDFVLKEADTAVIFDDKEENKKINFIFIKLEKEDREKGWWNESEVNTYVEYKSGSGLGISVGTNPAPAPVDHAVSQPIISKEEAKEDIPPFSPPTTLSTVPIKEGAPVAPEPPSHSARYIIQLPGETYSAGYHTQYDPINRKLEITLLGVSFEEVKDRLFDPQTPQKPVSPIESINLSRGEGKENVTITFIFKTPYTQVDISTTSQQQSSEKSLSTSLVVVARSIRVKE